MTIEEIIAGCKKQKEKCQFELVQRCASKLLGISRRYVRNSADAEDVLQEAFIKVFKYIDKFDADKGNINAWLARIVINTAIDYNKKYSVNYDQGEFLLGDRMNVYHQPGIFSQMSVKELLGLLERLPIGYRTVFNLYVIEQYNHKEIAEMLEIKEATSRSQLNKARKMLQKMVLYNENYNHESRAI